MHSPILLVIRPAGYLDYEESGPFTAKANSVIHAHDPFDATNFCGFADKELDFALEAKRTFDTRSGADNNARLTVVLVPATGFFDDQIASDNRSIGQIDIAIGLSTDCRQLRCR